MCGLASCRGVKRDGQQPGKVCEIRVCCKDRKTVSRRERADQEIGVRGLNAFCSAKVEERCGLLVVVPRRLDVGERSQVIPNFFEVNALSDSRKQLLPNRSNQRG